MSHRARNPRAVAVAVTLVLGALLAAMVLGRGGGPDAFAQGGYGGWFTSFTLDPAVAVRDTGTTHTVTARMASGNGFPLANVMVVYRVEGANPSAAAAMTDGQGRATISWTGANEGGDLLTAFGDFDRDGKRDAHEPQAVASVTWQRGATAATVRFPRKNRSLRVDRKGRFAFTILGDRGLRGRATFRTARAVRTSRRSKPRRLTLGSRRFTIGRNGRAVVRVKLSRRALAVVRSKRKLSVRATVKINGAGSASYTFRLNAPKRSRR